MSRRVAFGRMCPFRLTLLRAVLRATAVLTVLGGLASPARAQTPVTYTWNTGVTTSTWLNTADWTGGTINHFPGDTNANATGEGLSTDIAQIGRVGFSTGQISINMNT